jgi:peroxiredoxin
MPFGPDPAAMGIHPPSLAPRAKPASIRPLKGEIVSPMKYHIRSLLLAGFCTGLAVGALAKTAEVGQPAPDFTLTDIAGTTHQLSAYRGKTVVLEWVNPECPIVQKHYNKSGNMPKLQKAAAAAGVVWLSINSAASGKQGDYDATEVAAWMKRVGAAPTAYFRDQNGAVGKLYDARTTPHMFVIDPQGRLVYAGAIDSIRSADPADIAKAENYVTAALAAAKAGQPVASPTSQPYGCSVKY